MANNEQKITQYNADSIKVLEGLEAVRKRPGMYIGTTQSEGLHHMIWEIVDNAIDEAISGFATKVIVTLQKDGSVRVEDDGRDSGWNSRKTGVSGVETVLTVLHAGGKFDNNSYKVSDGLHGVGASVVIAASLWFKVWVHKQKQVHFVEFTNGGLQNLHYKL